MTILKCYYCGQGHPGILKKPISECNDETETFVRLLRHGYCTMVANRKIKLGESDDRSKVLKLYRDCVGLLVEFHSNNPESLLFLHLFGAVAVAGHLGLCAGTGKHKDTHVGMSKIVEYRFLISKTSDSNATCKLMLNKQDKWRDFSMILEKVGEKAECNHELSKKLLTELQLLLRFGFKKNREREKKKRRRQKKKKY